MFFEVATKWPSSKVQWNVVLQSRHECGFSPSFTQGFSASFTHPRFCF
jgi:hypothetical protein